MQNLALATKQKQMADQERAEMVSSSSNSEIMKSMLASHQIELVQYESTMEAEKARQSVAIEQRLLARSQAQVKLRIKERERELQQEVETRRIAEMASAEADQASKERIIREKEELDIRMRAEQEELMCAEKRKIDLERVCYDICDMMFLKFFIKAKVFD